MSRIEKELFDKYYQVAWENLYKINTNRTKIISFLVGTIAIFVAVVDYFNYKRGLWEINHGYITLFYAHIAYISSMYLFLLFYHFYKTKPKFYRFSGQIVSFLILNIGAFISGYIDQQLHGQITVYSATCFIVASSFCFEKKHSIFLFVQSYIMFIFYLFLSQNNPEYLQAHIINSFCTIILSGYMLLAVSKLMNADYMHKYKLEELVKTRSDALIEQQQAINRLQQLNIIGEMSAGIAHEIRNPMQSVRGFLQLLGSREYNQKDKVFFDLMISELDRANGIITEFLSLTKDKRNHFEKKDLNLIINKLLPLIDTNSKITVLTELDKLPEIQLDEKEICQVILNLANNGCDAMPSGGTLTIKTSKKPDKVVMEIIDQGHGIPPEFMDKIGTSFFTTKEKGTGLGVATCKSIIKQHGGKLDIESSPQGSNFKVTFNY